MAELTTFDQLKMQTETLKNFFENELNSGEFETINGGVKFIYKYKNEETPTVLQGVDSAENILFEGKNVTVPASASTVTVCGSGFNYDFESGTVSVASGVSNSSIMASGNLTIYGNGGGNLYQCDNSTILNYTDNDTVFSSNDNALKNAANLGTAYYFLNTHTIKGEKTEGAVTDTLNDYNDLGIGDHITFQNSNGDLTNLIVTLNVYIRMKTLEELETYHSWEDIYFSNNNDATAANNRSVLTAGAYYGSGNLYRTESAWMNGYAFSVSQKGYLSSNIDQTSLDDLFVNIQDEMNNNLETNGDYDLGDISKVSGDWDFGDTLTDDFQYNYRIHYPISITATYPVRSGKTAPDSLYLYIEPERIKQPVLYSNGTTSTRETMCSVRQIIITNDVANTDSTTNRPLIFFYEGPEVPLKQYHPELYDGDDYIGERPFLPVILSLYANFRGIIYAPNNPVIINGNGYKFEGFIVAREFRRLKIASDFQNSKYTSDSDKGFPVYVSATYNSGSYKYFIEVSNWTLKSSDPSGYKSIKVLFNGNEFTGWVKNNQWYTADVNPDLSRYAQINVDDATNNYALYDDILLETKRAGKTYLVNYNGKFYIPITTESATFSNSLTSSSIGDVFSTLGKTITQKVCPVISGSNYPMYISGTKYTYTETYTNTKGETKTKQTVMNVGDVMYEYIGTVAADNDGNGNYTETPVSAVLADDDKVRYNYTNIFNLKDTSIYNSFGNVTLQNYTYLDSDSHDMFFTTTRLKHID